MNNPSESLLQAIGLCRALDAGQVEEARREVLPRFPADPRSFAAELLRRQWLTPFQINRLVAGRGHELLRGGYVLLERLGEGGMGQVFKARNWKLGRIVALKIVKKELLTNATVVGRFRREIEATAQLDHPNLIRAFDADQDEDGLFIAMEYVEGIDLGRQVRESGPISAAKACEYIRQAALGLQYAHERGLVHRDIKPPNLFRSTQGDNIKVLDLGLARLRDPAQLIDETSRPALTQIGTIVGTVDFIAPEQARDSRHVDIRADLYSLGCTFCYLLTGRPPFPGGTPTERLLKHTLDPLPLLSEIPSAVRAVIHKLMAKKPEDRYQTPVELAEVLNGLRLQPEKLAQRRSADMLAPTVPTFQLPSAAPATTARGRMEPGPRPLVPTSGSPAALRPTADCATVVLNPPAPASIFVKPAPRLNLREQLLRPGWVYGAAGLAVLLVLMILPLLFPASTTKGEPKPTTPNEKKPPEKRPEPKPIVKEWDGVVREFLTVGPIWKNSKLTQQIEENPAIDAVYDDRFGQAYRWEVRKVNGDGAIKVPPGFTSRPALLFAQVFIHSPREVKARMLCSAADASRVWVNTLEVLETTAVRPQPTPSDDKINVTLKAGWNTVFVRLGARGERPFEFYLSFEDAEGLRVSLKPENGN